MLIKKLDNPGRVLDQKETKGLKSGLVVLKPGEEIGEHATLKREEVIIILEGRAEVVCDGVGYIVEANQLAYVEPEKNHNVKNIGREDLKYIYLVAMLK